MSKFLKFALLAIPVLSIGVYSSYQNHLSVISFEADGVVSYVAWDTKNHGMPLFEIKPEKGTVKKFHHQRIILHKDQIKIGDNFKKLAGSTNCLINNIQVPCIK